MRVVAPVLLGAIACSVGSAADSPERWAEHSHLYAFVLSPGGKLPIFPIIVQADAALEPLGFHRVPSSSEGQGRLYYRVDGFASATIVPGSEPGCIVFSATNYDEHVVGLANAAAAAVEGRFRKFLGSSFFSDSECSHAL